MHKVTDMFGVEIKKGDYIAYGVNVGRCASAKLGLVIETPTEGKIPVLGIKNTWNKKIEPTKKSTLFFEDRVLVLTGYKPTQEVLNYFKNNA